MRIAALLALVLLVPTPLGSVVGELRIAAFQEVENAAARRVFPAPHWHVEMSSRPIQEPGRACWDRPEARFGHVATGLAIHRGVAYRRNDDLKSLGRAMRSRVGQRTSR